MRLGSGEENPAAWPSLRGDSRALWSTDKRGFLCCGSHTLGSLGVTAHEENIRRGKRPRFLNRGSAQLLISKTLILCPLYLVSLSLSGECLEQPTETFASF